MEKIELRKARDFGQLFNVSISFLRLNFKSFFGAIIFLAGPFVMLTGLLTGFLQYISTQLTISNRLSGIKTSSINIFSGNSVSTLIIYGLIFLLTTLVTNASVALYFKLYDKTSPENLPVQRSNISPLLAAASWRLFYNLLLLIAFLVVFALACVGVFYLLFQNQNQEFKILLLMLLGFGYLMIAPILVYLLTVTNFIIIRDEILITAAIGKAIRYMRGSFWQTWVLMFCAVFSLSMIYLVFNAPSLILNLINTFTRRSAEAQSLSAATNNSLWYMMFGAISTLGGMLIISPILTCFGIFNFYNHEERHEGTSLLNRIDSFDIN